MHLKSIQPGKALIRLWSAVPDSRVWVGGIWALGLVLGVAGFLASLALPLAGAAALWLTAAGLGLLLVFRAEPMLRIPRAEKTEETLEPPPEPPSSPVPPLEAAAQLSVRGHTCAADAVAEEGGGFVGWT